MKKILVWIAGLALMGSVHAADTVTVSVPFKPGGLSGRLAEALKSAAHESNLALEVEYLGNCKQGEEKFRKGLGEIYVYPTSHLSIGDCKFPVSANNIVAVPYMQSLGMCHRRDRKELGHKHFFASNKKIIMDFVATHNVVEKWISDMNISDSAKILTVGRAADVLRSSFTNEADYFLMDSSDALAHKDRLDCVFVSNESGLGDWPALRSVTSKVSLPAVYTSQLLLTTEPKLQQKYQQFFSALQKKSAWHAVINQPGVEPGPSTNLFQFVEQQRKAYSPK